MTIFKPYDIRGLYPQEINEKVLYKVGQALVRLLGCKNIVIGRDMRLSSESLYNALVRGIISQGANVFDIGLSSTPMFYFSVNHLNADAGAMITASHNPKDYNGLKLVKRGAEPIVESGIKEIEHIVESDAFEDADNTGDIIYKDVLNLYVKYLKNYVPRIKPCSIVIDCGNGMAGKTVIPLLKSLGCKVKALYEAPNGAFPNHEANPLKPENTLELSKSVIESKAMFGAAFDGDADRVIFVDELGARIPGDITTALIAQEILSKKKIKVLYDLRSSRAVPELIKESGGEPVISRVGHSFIKEKMRKEDIYFAGEVSGHYYFKDNFFTDSAEIALLEILSLLSKEKKYLSSIVSAVQKYYHSGEISRNVHDKALVMKRVEEAYKKGRLLRLDGLTIEFDNWWFNLRESNTEPLIRLNLEANNSDLMNSKLLEVLSLIK